MSLKKDKPAKKTETNKPEAPAKPKVNTTVYVSNLNYKRDVVGIKKLFNPYGKVKKIKIVIDLETEKSKGMAFVEMGTVTEAKAAIAGLNGEVIDGRTLKASWAIPQEKPSFRMFDEDFDRKTSYRNSGAKKPFNAQKEKKPFQGAFKKDPKKKVTRKAAK